MNDTLLANIHPGCDQYSLIIEFGSELDYKFLLENGTTRRARVNEFESFVVIRGYAAVGMY